MTLLTTRRSLLAGLGAALAAPAVARASSLMPIRGVVMPLRQEAIIGWHEFFRPSAARVLSTRSPGLRVWIEGPGAMCDEEGRTLDFACVRDVANLLDITDRVAALNAATADIEQARGAAHVYVESVRALAGDDRQPLVWDWDDISFFSAPGPRYSHGFDRA